MPGRSARRAILRAIALPRPARGKVGVTAQGGKIEHFGQRNAEFTAAQMQLPRGLLACLGGEHQRDLAPARAACGAGGVARIGNPFALIEQAGERRPLMVFAHGDLYKAIAGRQDAADNRGERREA